MSGTVIDALTFFWSRTDARFGEVRSLVRTSFELSESEIVRFCDERLADYKVDLSHFA